MFKVFIFYKILLNKNINHTINKYLKKYFPNKNLKIIQIVINYFIFDLYQETL